MSGEGQTTPNDEGQAGGNQQTLEERFKLIEEQNKKLLSTNQRLLEESKTYKEKANSYQQSEAERLAEIEREKEEKLRKQGEYKQLLEQRDQKLKEKEAEIERIRKEKEDTHNTLIEARKLSAFENKLGGKLKSDEYLMFVDTKTIAIDPESNQVDVSSVDDAVKSFLAKHEHLVDFQAGKMPNFEGGKGNPITADRWKKMGALKDKKENLSAAVESYRKKKK